MKKEGIKCDYPREEAGVGWVCRITGFSSHAKGKLAKQCPVDEKNECAKNFVEEKGFWWPDRTVVLGQGRGG
jgi:hypothetical protein